MEDNYFKMLNSINVNEHTEIKDTGRVKLTYLSWAWAWAEVKKLFPDATYAIYENANGMFYHTDGKTCWVKTGVTINNIEHIEYLPVMDNRNASIPLERVTSFDVNKAIQRSLTKAAARHGLGLYIYAGEDLPEDDDANDGIGTQKKAAKQAPKQASAPEPTGKDIGVAITILKDCKTQKELKSVFATFPQYKDNKEFKDTANALWKQLPVE